MHSTFTLGPEIKVVKSIINSMMGNQFLFLRVVHNTLNFSNGNGFANNVGIVSVKERAVAPTRNFGRFTTIIHPTQRVATFAVPRNEGHWKNKIDILNRNRWQQYQVVVQASSFLDSDKILQDDSRHSVVVLEIDGLANRSIKWLVKLSGGYSGSGGTVGVRTLLREFWALLPF
jgi:hypothetical protein